MSKGKGVPSNYKTLRKSIVTKFIRFLRNITGNIQEELEVAVDRGNLEKVKELLALGADPNVRFGFQQTTFLHRARNPEVIKELVSHGADINAKDVYDCTPLYYSVTKESSTIVRELLANGADVNAMDDNGVTPLGLALKDYPKLEVVMELLEHGANTCLLEVERYMMCYFTRSCAAIKSMQLPVAKQLIKFALLQHFVENYTCIVDLEPFSKCKNHEELTLYRDECVSEIVQMKADKINNDFSIFDYIHRKPRNIKPYSDKKYREQELSAKYPIYHEVILSYVKPCLERSELLDSFTRLQISVVSRGRDIVLSFDCLCVIAEYLSNEELSNFISHFEIYSEHSNFSNSCSGKKKQCREVELYTTRCVIF